MARRRTRDGRGWFGSLGFRWRRSRALWGLGLQLCRRLKVKVSVRDHDSRAWNDSGDRFDLHSQFARSGQRSFSTSMLRRPCEVSRITVKSGQRLEFFLDFGEKYSIDIPSPSTPISLPVSCQYFSIAGVESIIVPSISKSKAEKSTTSAGAEKLLSSW